MAKKDKPDPKKTAADLLKRLEGRADKKKAASYQRFFKEPVLFWGIDTPNMRDIRDDLYKEVEAGRFRQG